MRPPSSVQHGTTVGDLLKILDGTGLRLATASTALRLPSTSPTLYDPLAPPTGSRSGVLLGIGLHPAALESTAALRAAARGGFGAVVIKAFSESVETLAAVAEAEHIALLVADDDIEWRQLDGLITAALVTASETGDSPSSSTLVVGDLFALANAIAAMVGGATAIEDLQERVLAYSTLPGQPIDADRREGILGRQVPELPENAEQYAQVFRSAGAVRLSGVGAALDRLAVAVRAGTQALGSIWVVDAGGVLGPDAPRALERAAEIAALHLLRARSAADLARQQRAELLRRLLEGGDDSSLLIDQLGLDPAGPFIVLAFQPEFAPAADELRMARLADLIAMQCQSHQPGAECALIGNTVYALFAGPAASAADGVHTLAKLLVSRAQAALRVALRASVGSPVTTVGMISRSRHDADLVLLLLAGRPGSTVVASARDVRSELTLLELAQVFRDTPRFVSEPARLMTECDARAGTEYAKTLRTYLDCARDSAAAAAVLSLHQNTLRYRLRRAQELFGVDLSHADNTLSLWLSLRLAEFA
jgi:hypothetical protein